VLELSVDRVQQPTQYSYIEFDVAVLSVAPVVAAGNTSSVVCDNTACG